MMTINCESLLVKLANILYFNLWWLQRVQILNSPSLLIKQMQMWRVTTSFDYVLVLDEPRINEASAAVKKNMQMKAGRSKSLIRAFDLLT